MDKKRVRIGLELDENWMNIVRKLAETRGSGIGVGASLYVQAKSLGATMGIYNCQIYDIKNKKEKKKTRHHA